MPAACVYGAFPAVVALGCVFLRICQLRWTIRPPDPPRQVLSEREGNQVFLRHLAVVKVVLAVVVVVVLVVVV